MNPLLVALLASAFLNAPQQKPGLQAAADEVRLSAVHEIKGGDVIQLRGDVEIATTTVTIHADEADYNPLTGSVDARGHVQISLHNSRARLNVTDGNPEDLGVIPPR